MDTLTSYVSTLKVPPKLHTTRHDERLQHLKKTSNATQKHFFLSQFAAKTRPNKTNDHFLTLSLNPNNHLASQISFLVKPSSVLHTNPASGYAAAILDIARSKNSLHQVQNNAHKLLNLLQNVHADEAGVIIKEVVKRGKVNRLLVRFLKMLMEKNKVGLVSEVLMEFLRICDELSGTKVVYVSSKKKMEVDELLGVAKNVQLLTGALNVKVRHVFGHNLPAFAL